MFKPKYKQIIDDIISQIDSGDLEQGMQLPSQRDMASLYQVNRSTVIQALDILKSQGIIEGRENNAYMYLEILGILILKTILIGKTILAIVRLKITNTLFNKLTN